MNKIGCRCYICDHFNEVGGHIREFPLPDMCNECYSAISSALIYEPEEKEVSPCTGNPLDARPEPTSGHLDPIGGITDPTEKETTVVEEDSTGACTVS